MNVFLFSNDCFNPKQPDKAYRDRYFAFQEAGFRTVLIELESLDLPKQKRLYIPLMLLSVGMAY